MKQILEALGVDYIDESEVLTPADDSYHVEKHDFKIPFVCGCRNLGEALRRIGEGAAMSEPPQLIYIYTSQLIPLFLPLSPYQR